MLKKNIYYNYLVIAALLLTLNSCSKQEGVKEIISQVEDIVEQHPDSALQLLNKVLFPEELKKNLFNKYNLLMFQAKDKSYKDITSDTVIFAVKDYYISKKDIPNATLAAFYCGRLWYEKENIEEAAKAYMEAEQLADKTDNYNLRGLIQGNMGILHRTHFSKEKAIEFYKNSVEMFDKAKNYRNKISTMRSIGDCFLLSKNVDSAFYYYDESLKLAELHNIPKMQSDIKHNMGVAFRNQGLYEQAKTLFNEALTFPCDSVEKARTLLNIAQVYDLENNVDSINYYLDKALVLKTSNPALMRTSYILRSNIAEKNKQYKEALNYYKEYYSYTKDVFNNEKNNKLLEIQGKYDNEKLKNLANNMRIIQQKILIIFSFALLLAGIIIFLFYRKSERNKMLLLETEQKIMSLQKMADNFSKDNNTFRNYLLDHFGILKKTALLKNLLNANVQVSGEKMLKKFIEIVYGSDIIDWNVIFPVMDDMKYSFYSKIRIKYPQLIESEFRICCLTCETNFTDKEIEIILGMKLHEIRRIRSNMRKKIGMSKGENYLTFFKNAV